MYFNKTCISGIITIAAFDTEITFCSEEFGKISMEPFLATVIDFTTGANNWMQRKRDQADAEFWQSQYFAPEFMQLHVRGKANLGNSKIKNISRTYLIASMRVQRL